MVDLRDIHGRRAIIPQKQPALSTTREGFVQMPTTSEQEPSVLGFLDNPISTTAMPSATSSDDLRKLTERLERLDNILYKLEQRIELLERKVGVNQGY